VLGQGSTFIVSIPLGQDHLASGQIGGDRPLSSTATGAAPFVEEALLWLPESERMDTSSEIAPDYELMAVPAPSFSEGASRSRVLIVDDNADMRLYLIRLLSERFEVQAVPNGQAALEAIKLRTPDLVLSDAMMPELDGFGLLRELRSKPETRTIPFLLVSARAGEESRVEGLDAGADDYLVKLFSARELIARVQTHLQLAQVRQEAEKAIRESETKLQLSLRASNMGVFYWHPDEDRTEADARVLEIFGLSSTSELTLAEALTRMIHPNDRNKYAEGVKRSLDPDGDGRLQEEIRIRLADAQERWISVIAQVQSTGDSKAGRMAGLIGDITDRKQAEDTVRRRSAQYETLLNRAPLGVYTIDSEFRILDVSPTALPVFGNIPDLIGRDLNEVMHILWPGDYADEVVRIFRHTLETGEPYQTTESVHHRRDRDLKEFYEWRIDRIPLPQPGYGVVCYFRDISRFVHARQTIADSQERLRLATEAAELGIWRWHLDEDRVTWENDRPYEIFDRRREDGPIKAAEFRAKVIHPEDAQIFEQAISEMLQTGTPLFFQGRINRRDGSTGWIELTGRLERRADSSPWRVLGTVLDISQRKKTEELMHQHRNRFDIVAKIAQVGFWFCDLPFDKLIWDSIVKEHFWLPPDAEVTIETFYERLHPDDRERTRETIAESNAKDLPYDIEYRTVSPDGRQKWIRAMGRTFDDPAGEPKRFDGLTLDISQRKLAEQTNSLLAAVVDYSDDAIISISLDGVITSWNQSAERLFGYKEQEAIGRPIELIIPPDRQNEEATILEKIRRGERIEHFETIRVRKDGTQLDVSLTISPVKNHSGLVTDASKTARDITERKRAEQALHRSEARMTDEANALAKLNDWSHRLWRVQNLKEGLDEMLTGVIELLGADKGNIQLLDTERGVLRIAAQRGFDQEFLDFFQEVSANDDSACGRALRLRQPVVIEDVEADAPFAPFRSVARASRFRSVVSASLIRADGTPIGILSSHFVSVHRPTDQDLRRLDLYVRQCVDFVQRCKTEEALRQSEERFRAIFETTPECVKLVTSEGILLHMNSSWLKMVGANCTDSVVGKNVYDLIALEDRDRFRDFDADSQEI